MRPAPQAEEQIRGLVAAGHHATLRMRTLAPFSTHVHIVIDNYGVAGALDDEWPWFEESVLEMIQMCLRKPNPNASSATCDCFRR